MDQLQNEPEGLPLVDATDTAILMHRDAHFGGQFGIMLDYYAKGGKGINSEFEIERIKELQLLEQGLKQNLAALLLSGQEAEQVARARESYKVLRSVYNKKNELKPSHARLIADLILTEDEEALNEIEAIVAEKSLIVPALMNILRSEDFHDPLFPGYGLAPALATKCLGLIGDKRAIISLFESIGDSDFLNEDLALDALFKIGEPAKAFLLSVLHSRPITYDNERAAMALCRFKDDPDVAKICLQMLSEIDLKKHLLLATHLVLACEGLKDADSREKLLALLNHPNIPSMLRQDIKAIAKSW